MNTETKPDIDTPDREVLTVAEAAALLRIGRNLAYDLITEGRLPHVRIGHRIIIPRQQLMDWLEAEADSSNDADSKIDSASRR